MAETYPSEVDTFKVIGRLVKGVADSSDPDEDPDVIPIVGATVIFTPGLTPPIFRVPTAQIPITVFQESIVATTDENGYLKIEEDSELGVELPWGMSPNITPTGWPWNVNISVGGNFSDRAFSIAGTSGGVVDLATVIPVPANPGSEISSWVAVVTEAQNALITDGADLYVRLTSNPS